MDFEYNALNPIIWGVWAACWALIVAIVCSYRKKHRFHDENGEDR